MLRFSFVVLGMLGLLLPVAGCGGGSDTPDVLPVTGIITLDGDPLEGAQVEFQPQSTSENQAAVPSYATTDKSGAYTLKLGPGRVEGAMPGTHQVRITKYPPPAEDGTSGEQILPAKYNSESELTVEVTSDNEDGYDFDLESN
ncbi:carboxypeptidase-like regulatory domain-containing protein [Rubinisphaera brasiliensis]|uniref:Carboxypeptidase regulatory-like domain-containing protein n=1 Tax=Rubinisphaera brasiliensis (strain ATCC 49424 / DSM 5305 / JCM 21570 / IAM 15109 / NBRC 103401 / IFAM 1448) TaxID=756272 RepID=F0SKV9_RUBBR|nr:carboxypeptidase-like regulatory domain-containing protein [Rubinisphaera brasiliensis]ADY59812.1 hypothetical protein Plabr_2210 [Rubinisphaera brasiliensis DSM 5305]